MIYVLIILLGIACLLLNYKLNEVKNEKDNEYFILNDRINDLSSKLFDAKPNGSRKTAAKKRQRRAETLKKKS